MAMGFTRTQSLASSCVMDAPDNTTLPRRKAPVKGRSIAVGGHTPVKGGETRNADRRLQGPDGLRADNENTRTRLRELSEPFGSRPACPQPCTHKPCGRNTDQAPSATCCNTHAPCAEAQHMGGARRQSYQVANTKYNETTPSEASEPH